VNVNIIFRHMEHTPALDQIIHEKSAKLTKWLGSSLDIKWICWIEGTDHCAEVKIKNAHEEFFAKASTDDLYKTIDLVIQKIHNQLK
jgi:putative sigma-54 modulation protein